MKRILLFAIGIIAFMLNANAETYTHTFKTGELTTAGGNVTLSGFEWTASAANVIDWNAEKGIQIGKKAEACKNFSLKTSAFAGFTIKSVAVYSSIASSGDAKLTIQAGSAISQQFSITGTNSAYRLDCNEKGNITISWSATQRAYYVNKIEVVYEMPADMVDVEEPVFKTPTDSIYADKVQVAAETEDQNLVLYYTIDGTDPSYEDYNSDPRVGTTKCSKYWVLYENLTNSNTVNTIRAMAVKVDGESIYKSDIVEAKYIVSTTKPFVPAATVDNSAKYAFVAGNDSIADALVPGRDSGYLNGRKTAKHDKFIEAPEYDAFTFTATAGGYTIQDASGRYMYNDGASSEFSFSAEKPAAGAVWSVAMKSGKAEIKNGNGTIYYVASEDKFGCYANAESGMELPVMYMLREYPEATFSPENNSHVKGLQEIVITCAEGIGVSDGFTLKAVGNQDKNGKYEVDATYRCEQVDKNTLKFTIDTPLKSYNNINIDIVITGDILLNPEGMNYPLPIKGRYIRSICSYTHKGDAPAAEITAVSPADGSKVETLKYILFTFSNITGKSEDWEKSVRLHREGSDELIPVEFSNYQEDSDTPIEDEMQCALAVTEPVTANGVYLLEIEDGYFEDRNGNPVKGMTLKYIVENDGSGIEETVTEGETSWVVYDITGIKVLDTTDASALGSLNKGIYIINGKKRIVL